MNFKRCSCILLALVTAVSLAACGSTSSTNSNTVPRITQPAVNISTLADAERANFPDPTEGYSLVIEEAKADKRYLDVYLGKQIAAYKNLSDEEACKYLFDQHKEMNSYLTAQLSIINSSASLLRLDGTDEAIATADKMSAFNLTFSAILATWAEWNVKYQSIDSKAEDAPTYDELMEAAAYIINQTSNLFYGKDMVR